MYPILRTAWQLWLHRKAPKMGLCDRHVSHHICLPVDIDPWMELNNGRTLTLFDMGRMTAGLRMGLPGELKRRGWGMAVAGASVRYRKRVTMFQRIEMHTEVAGWDDRFIYLLQAMWVGGTCTSQALLRTAFTSREGTRPPSEVAAAMGWTDPSPELPQWVADWIAAEGTRPWPPEAARDATLSKVA